MRLTSKLCIPLNKGKNRLYITCNYELLYNVPSISIQRGMVNKLRNCISFRGTGKTIQHSFITATLNTHAQVSHAPLIWAKILCYKCIEV